MRRKYIQPQFRIWNIESQGKIMAASDVETDTLPVYTDDPQATENALSRHYSIWTEDEEDN